MKKTFSDPRRSQSGSQKLREAYERKMENMAQADRVYLDETGSCINMTLPYGRARRGEVVREKKPAHGGERLNTIALLSETGIQGEYHYSGTLNAEKFIFYLEYVALPSLVMGQVLIMDRHPVHCAREVRRFLRKNQVKYLYLPPYSPELNPIEEMFSKIKHYIKKHKPRTLNNLFKAIKESFRTITLQDVVGYFKHANSFINQY
ncbi:MAG: IS630 family transposase [Gammaproteobacteria bacterium]|nr:IS630 family transposase [Gammaproteobacteria bacterium]MCP5426468.1 IS630 family transposase [Gammaproteobacteria bacterium]